jgi:hypothetical protein
MRCPRGWGHRVGPAALSEKTGRLQGALSDSLPCGGTDGMTASLTLACVWAIIASIMAMVPRRFHWPGAVALIATGIPLLGWVTWQNGPLWGMLVLAGGASMLRWPVVRLARRLSRGHEAQEPAE